MQRKVLTVPRILDMKNQIKTYRFDIKLRWQTIKNISEENSFNQEMMEWSTSTKICDVFRKHMKQKKSERVEIKNSLI